MEEFFNQVVILEKFHGKGGWTYAPVPMDRLPAKKYFGMLEVSGSVDDFAFRKKHLMPMGNGTVFLPVSKEIRKKIHKEAGDEVRLILYTERIPDQVPGDLKACLQDDPGKWESFQKLSEEEQKSWIETIYSSSDEDHQVRQILRLLNFLT
ncbi:MAG: YdeI/OmpD-associated family protein [Cyclobacteriaceae bacterium]|nr:YdeI/OmpD-associated family protein [Cyclobacteriaceae bacterium]MDX5465711.1 YdeI/OmpD-associated family protein [Cyclobacteriaceae bacterium]